MYINNYDAFIKIKTKHFDNSIIINSVEDAKLLHKKLIDFSLDLSLNGVADIMPHYRGEQDYKWDIRSGVFRNKMKDNTSENGKKLEKMGKKIENPNFFICF